MERRKIRTRSIIVLLILALLCCCSGCKKNKDESGSVSDDEAEQKKDESRYITIVNGTDSSTINLVEIATDSGIPIVNLENPDSKSYSFKIDETWKDYSNFVVTLIDVYGLKFEQAINDLPAPGKLDVKITEDDYVEQPGDWSRKMERKINEGK